MTAPLPLVRAAHLPVVPCCATLLRRCRRGGKGGRDGGGLLGHTPERRVGEGRDRGAGSTQAGREPGYRMRGRSGVGGGGNGSLLCRVLLRRSGNCSRVLHPRQGHFLHPTLASYLQMKRTPGSGPDGDLSEEKASCESLAIITNDERFSKYERNCTLK